MYVKRRGVGWWWWWATCMFGGEHVVRVVSRRVWNWEIASLLTGVGSARRRTAVRLALASACCWSSGVVMVGGGG